MICPGCETKRASHTYKCLESQLADADRVSELVKARHKELEAENAQLRTALDVARRAFAFYVRRQRADDGINLEMENLGDALANVSGDKKYKVVQDYDPEIQPVEWNAEFTVEAFDSRFPGVLDATMKNMLCRLIVNAVQACTTTKGEENGS